MQTKKYNIFLNYNLTAKIYTMDYPKFIVSNQKEESISIQRVNKCFSNRLDFNPIALHVYVLWMPQQMLKT